MILRDYQTESVEFLVPRRRGFIVAPAGSGKTVIGANAIARKAWPGCRVTWLANTREQVEQAIAAIQRTGGPENVHFDVCCVAANPDIGRADIVVFDEAHHLPAETWHRLFGRIRPDAVVWGLSATPYGPDPERNALLDGAFEEFHTIARERVLASGHLVEGKVYLHDIDTPAQFDEEINARTAIEVRRRMRIFRNIPQFEHERRAKWQITQEFVQANAARNGLAVYIANAEAAKGESVLMLVHSIEHGQSLVEQMPGSVIVHSKLGKKARQAAIEGLRSGAIKILVATSLADEGLDVPRASVLVLVAGGRSAAKLEQRAGRVLRPFENKKGGTIHDFMDRGAAFALSQANARFRVYSKLGYEPELVGPEFWQKIAA